MFAINMKILKYRKPKLKAVRLGTKTESKVRPFKLTLSSASVVQRILSKSRKLRVTDKFKYLSADRSAEERSRRRKLVHQLKEKKEAEAI